LSRSEIDAYLANVEEPKRSTLEELRKTILDVIPEAEECISYQMPAFRVEGHVIAGFAAFRDHLSYFPFSGSIPNQLHDELAKYKQTVSALHFAVDKPLPRPLVKRLIELRLDEAGRTRQ